MLLLVIIAFTATESKLRQDLPWEIVGRLELNSLTPRNALKTAAASLSRRYIALSSAPFTVRPPMSHPPLPEAGNSFLLPPCHLL